MPSRSNKQARTMAGAAHNPEFAAKMGIPQNVARKYNRADQASGRLSRAMKEKKG